MTDGKDPKMLGTNDTEDPNPADTTDTKSKAELQNRSYASPILEVILPRAQIKDPVHPVKTILFLHVPKAGGTNLSLIVDALQRIKKLKITRFAVPRIPGKSPNLILENWTGGLKTALTALKDNPDCCKDLNFISGHIPFGLHEKIKNSHYVALIRDPIERELSSLNFDYQRGFVPEGETENYLFKGIDNPQTRMLAGIKYMTGEHPDLLEQAKKNIEEKFLLAGVTEDTNVFIEILASIQGWEPVATARAQVTGKKIIATPTPEMKAKLEIKHSIDMELYKWVKNRWNKFKKQFEENSVTLKTNPQQKILCLQPEYAQTREIALWTLEQIEAYNKKIKPDASLVEISQTHVELRLLGINQANAITPAFAATAHKNQSSITETMDDPRNRDQIFNF